MVLKNNIRGPSIIFNRCEEVDKTLIRGSKLCRNIIGFDANALYLWAIMQDMPVGKYINTNKGFRVIDNYMIAYTQQKKGLGYKYDKELLQVMVSALYHYQSKNKKALGEVHQLPKMSI